MYKVSLSKEDFLNYQLFTASKSERVKKQRVITWLLITLLFFVLAVTMIDTYDKYLSYLFLFCSLVTLLFYPLYQTILYHSHYEKNVIAQHEHQFGIESDLHIIENSISMKSEDSDEIVNISDIQEFIEIPQNLFIKLKSGVCLIIPSSITNYKNLKGDLIQLSKGANIPWDSFMDWKWK